MDYNYGHFDAYVEAGQEIVEFSAWPNRLHAGERAPDGSLTRLSDGEKVSLSDLWSARGIVLEFGSFT